MARKRASKKVAKKATTSTTKSPKKSASRSKRKRKMSMSEAAFARLKARIDATVLPPNGAPRFNLQGAAVHAMKTATFLADEPLATKITAMHAIEVLDGELVWGLADVAQAALHVERQAKKKEATESSALLPVELANDATGLRQRMLKTLDYYLEDDAAAAATLAYIRMGSGYLDLAADLAACAELYGKHRALIEADTKHYRAEDAPRARELSDEISSALSRNPSPTWSLRRKRVATLLARHYNEAARVGRFLAPDEQHSPLFESLFSATRRPKRFSRPEASAGTDIGESEASAPASE